MQEGGFWETDFRLAWLTHYKATIVTILAEGALEKNWGALSKEEGGNASREGNPKCLCSRGSFVSSVCEVYMKAEYNSTV